MRTEYVLRSVRIERTVQASQSTGRRPHGTGSIEDNVQMDVLQQRLKNFDLCGVVTWRDQLALDVATAFATEESMALRDALIKVAARAIGWVEDIDTPEWPARKPQS